MSHLTVLDPEDARPSPQRLLVALIYLGEQDVQLPGQLDEEKAVEECIDFMDPGRDDSSPPATQTSSGQP